MIHLSITEQEFAHVLAGLRLFQRPTKNNTYVDIVDELVLNEGHPKLGDGEIDSLCERLNLGIAAQNDDAANAYRNKAKNLFHADGEVEIDDDALVSMGDDPGAYVQGWLWVPDDTDEE